MATDFGTAGGKAKNKKNKGIKLDINDVMDPNCFKMVDSWADEMENEEVRVPAVTLPTAPKASTGIDIDLESIPTNPPFKAYVSGISFNAEAHQVEKFFAPLTAKVSMITESGRSGNAFVEFESRLDLIEALHLNGRMMGTRQLKIQLSSSTQRSGFSAGAGGHGGRRNFPDNTPSNWRTREGLPPKNAFAPPPTAPEFEGRSGGTSGGGGFGGNYRNNNYSGNGGFNRDKNGFGRRGGDNGFTGRDRFGDEGGNWQARGKDSNDGGDSNTESNWRTAPRPVLPEPREPREPREPKDAREPREPRDQREPPRNDKYRSEHGNDREERFGNDREGGYRNDRRDDYNHRGYDRRDNNMNRNHYQHDRPQHQYHDRRDNNNMNRNHYQHDRPQHHYDRRDNNMNRNHYQQHDRSQNQYYDRQNSGSGSERQDRAAAPLSTGSQQSEPVATTQKEKIDVKEIFQAIIQVEDDNEPRSYSSIFGGAKPVNTNEKELEIERRLAEAAEKKAAERKAAAEAAEKAGATAAATGAAVGSENIKKPRQPMNNVQARKNHQNNNQNNNQNQNNQNNQKNIERPMNSNNKYYQLETE